MTTKERIKAEIKRLKIDVWDEASQFDLGARSSLTYLNSFLDTLDEQPSEDLEEAAYKYSIDSRPSIYGQVDVIDAFKAGARWQKEQMMNEAVNGEAHPDDCEIWCNLVGYGHKFKDGDKVKIIIVKEA